MTDEIFKYLDNLRESGETNMWGAEARIAITFGLTKPEARTVLIEWMNTFDDGHPPG